MLAGCMVFFFKQKTAYEMRISVWSSDVCSSDLRGPGRTWPLPATACVIRLRYPGASPEPGRTLQYGNSDALASQRDHPEGAWHHPRRCDAALPPAAPVRWLAELQARTVGEGGRLGDHGQASSQRGRRLLADAGLRDRNGLVSDLSVRLLSGRGKEDHHLRSQSAPARGPHR